MPITDLGEAADVTTVERQRIDVVLAELRLQQSDFVDPFSARSFGKGLGATAVVTGGFTASQGTVRIDTRVVDVAGSTASSSTAIACAFPHSRASPA